MAWSKQDVGAGRKDVLDIQGMDELGDVIKLVTGSGKIAEEVLEIWSEIKDEVFVSDEKWSGREKEGLSLIHI